MPASRTLVALVLTTVMSALVGCGGGSPEGRALYESVNEARTGMQHSTPGEPHFFGLIEVRPLGDQPVHLLRAEMLDVPNGVVVDGVWAMRLSEVGEFPGALKGPAQAAHLRPLYRRVDEVIVDPSCPPEARCQPRTEPGPRGTPVQDWILIVECHITRPGDFEIKGFRVVYEVGGRRQTQSFLNHHIALHSGERPD